MSLLACHGIRYRRDGRDVLAGVDLEIRSGEIVSLLGANGAGKSTLLRILLGLMPALAGEVTLHDRPLSHYARKAIARQLAYVPQQHHPAFPYTVEQIVMLGRLPHTGIAGMTALSGVFGGHGQPSDNDLDAVWTAMHRMQVESFADRVYTELSGGERQRVMIARALAQGAPMLILDEPIAGLDFGHQMRLLLLLRQLADEGRTILTTTHRPEQALIGSTRAVLLHEGRVFADGAPREVVNAASMSLLYQVPLRQIDHADDRFFVPAASFDTAESAPWAVEQMAHAPP